MTDSQILELNDKNFDDTIKTGVILVDFYAIWCAPCRTLAPVLKQVATDLGAKAKIAKLDIDESHKVAGSLQVTSVPTMILFKEGKEINRLLGLHAAQEILEFVTAVL